MNLLKRGWVAGLMAIIVMGCGQKDDCDFTVIVNDLKQQDGSNPVEFHDISDNKKIAQRFQPSQSFILSKISFTLKRFGDPKGEFRVFIHEKDNSKNRPEDKPITDGRSEEVDVSAVKDTFFTEVGADFPDEPKLNSGRDYYFVLDFIGDDVSSVNYFKVGAVSTSNGAAFPNGEMWRFDSSDNDKDTAWTLSNNSDLQFRMEKCESDN